MGRSRGDARGWRSMHARLRFRLTCGMASRVSEGRTSALHARDERDGGWALGDRFVRWVCVGALDEI